jgi:hypothetical protein
MHQRHSPCALADFAAGDVRHGSIKRVASAGRTVMATASILDEDGHATSLGKLGLFANKDGALAFAVRCTTAFIDGDDMPLPPFQLSSQRGAPAFRRAVSPGPGLRCQPMNVAFTNGGPNTVQGLRLVMPTGTTVVQAAGCDDLGVNHSMLISAPFVAVIPEGAQLARNADNDSKGWVIALRRCVLGQASQEAFVAVPKWHLAGRRQCLCRCA